jgi:hypothetical protein
VQHGQDVYRVGSDAIDQQVIRMNHGLSCSGHPAGTLEIRMIRQLLAGVYDQALQPVGRIGIAV